MEKPQDNCILRLIIIAGTFLLLVFTDSAWAGKNSLTAGLTIGYDYNEREYEDERSEDVYQRISIRPMLQYDYAASPLDTLGIKIAPSVKYDLEESETDWDYADVKANFQKSLTKHWLVNGSNSYLRSDAHEPDGSSQFTESTGEEAVDQPERTDDRPTQTDAPDLSDEAGRKRFWRNDLQLGTSYTYSPGSLVYFGIGYNVLRNDSDEENYEDYDRYAFNFRDKHVFTKAWSSTLDLGYIIGDYEEKDPQIDEEQEINEATAVDLDEENLSKDLEEYRASVTFENRSYRQHVFSLNYNYIGSKYDEEEQNDSDLHQGRLTWFYQYSKQLSTILGAGPSYVEVEGQDANYGGNGIAAINYQFRHGSLGVELKKNYEVENFSGTDESGYVDRWDASLRGDYRFTRAWTLSGNITYSDETREEPTINTEATTEEELVVMEEYSKEAYGASLGLYYNFLRYYRAGIRYTFMQQQGDRVEDEYDDHRVFLTLSWNREMYRW